MVVHVRQSGKSLVADRLAAITHRNLLNLSLQAHRELQHAQAADEREHLVKVGDAISRAGLVILPLVIEGGV